MLNYFSTKARAFVVFVFSLSFIIGRLPRMVWIVGSTVFWGILPVATLLVVGRKKD